MVPEIMTGSFTPRSAKTCWIATMAAFAFNVSKMVSTRMISEPPSTRPRTCSAYKSPDVIEGHGAKARIVDVRRNGKRTIGRPDGARDEAAASILLLRDQPCFPCDPGTFAIELVDQLLHAVIGLGDGSARKRVRLDDIRSSQKVAQVDVAHRIGLCENEQVIVAFDVLPPILETVSAKVGLGKAGPLQFRSHGTVKHQDSLCGDFPECPRYLAAVDHRRSKSRHIFSFVTVGNRLAPLRRHFVGTIPQSEKTADCVDKVGAVHGVEVKFIDTAIDEIDHLLGRHRSCDEFPRLHIVVETLETGR